MIVDEFGQKIASAEAALPPPAQELPKVDAYVGMLLNAEQTLNDAFDKLDPKHQRVVLDEIERRRHARRFQQPGALQTLFPGLGARRH